VSLCPELERLLQSIDERRADEARRGLRALELAPTLEIYQALMRGEKVPVDQLNREAVLRYGLKR
jgi:hypothetical protein